MKDKLLESFKEGLYLLVKYSILIMGIIYAYAFAMQTRQMAINGEQAAIAIREYQEKGVLPKFPLGEKK